MINNYEIKIQNNEEVLFLYFDFTMEIGNQIKSKNTSPLEKINKYIKQKKISFKGKKIVLVTSGIVIASLLLSPGIKIQQKDYSYVSKILFNDYNRSSLVSPMPKLLLEINNYNKNKIVNFVPDTEEKKQELSIEKDVESSFMPSKLNDEEKDNKTSLNNVQDIDDKKDNQITGTNITTHNYNITTNVQENISADDISNVIDESRTETVASQELNVPQHLITLYRGNGEIIEMDIEEYLIGVVAGEMPALFNIEALKSQAIVSRTYTLKQLSLGKKITDVSTQNYKNNQELHIKWGNDYEKYYNKIKEAVESTRGMYITYEGNIIDAVFSCVTNGLTEDAINVWGYSIPYLKSVDSSWDVGTTYYTKTSFISYEEISNKLGVTVDNNTPIEILTKSSSNRVSLVKIRENEYNGVELRNLLSLASSDYDLEKNDMGITFVTRGYGHGVGMSQYGANGLANKGYSFDMIIKYYYHGVNLVNN